MKVFPSAALARCEIWEETIRSSLKQPRYKKKDIDDRKAQASRFRCVNDRYVADVMTEPHPRTTVGAAKARRPHTSTSGTTITWLRPVWHAWLDADYSRWMVDGFLLFVNVYGSRVGGQRERQTQAFEAGVPYFPRDYPSIPAYGEQISKTADEEEARWKRTPAAKKPNFEKLGTRSPWRHDWEVVLGLKEPESQLVPTQREAQGPEGEDLPSPEDVEPKDMEYTAMLGKSPWLLRGALLKYMSLVPDFIKEINRLRTRRSESHFDFKDADLLLRSALVPVQLSPCGRGVLKEMSMIYMLEDHECEEARKLLAPIRKKAGGRYLGHSLGAIAAIKYQALVAQARRWGYFSSRNRSPCSLRHRLSQGTPGGAMVSRFLVKGRNRDGQSSWLAHLEANDFSQS
ncbi:Ribonucleases P/MRP protein [Salix suchowensis]|nr:Ribonucleases P/MRP protein [Salix suchowensis]